VIDTSLTAIGYGVVALVTVERDGTTEAQDLADGFTVARMHLADIGLRTSTWGTAVLRAIPGHRLFEVTFRNVTPNDNDVDIWGEPSDA
jgi:hypothetical protein